MSAWTVRCPSAVRRLRRGMRCACCARAHSQSRAQSAETACCLRVLARVTCPSESEHAPCLVLLSSVVLEVRALLLGPSDQTQHPPSIVPPCDGARVASARFGTRLLLVWSSVFCRLSSVFWSLSFLHATPVWRPWYCLLVSSVFSALMSHSSSLFWFCLRSSLFRCLGILVRRGRSSLVVFCLLTPGAR